ncbi:MAG: Gfo/Idh/MocA family oxidoreductase [Caldimonas sp.]
MRSQRPSIAIIGAGLMGHWHAAAASRAGARIAAIVDADGTRGAKLARRHGSTCHTSLAGLLEAAQRPVAAHVCTPLESHAGLVQQLVDGGMHVVCEKPLAASASEVVEMVTHARRTGRALCPVHQFTCQHGFLETQSRLGEIGDLRRIAFTFNSAGGRDRTGERLDAVLREILPHPLSILAQLQPAIALERIEWHCASAAVGELLATGQHGPATVSISISLSARPTEASATLSGTAGTMRLDFFHGYSTLNRGQASRADKVLRPFANAFVSIGAASGNALRRVLTWETAYPGLRALFEKFYGGIEGGRASAPFGDAEVIGIYVARDRIAAAMAREGIR